MKEMQDILDAYGSVGEFGPAAALATLVRTEGPTFRKPGARMLLIEGGHQAGLLCGGGMEKELHERARLVTAGGRPSTVLFDHSGTPAEAEAGCHGKAFVLLEPLSGRLDEGAIGIIRIAVEERRCLVVATVCTDEPGGGRVGQRVARDDAGTIRLQPECAELARTLTELLPPLGDPCASVYKEVRLGEQRLEVFLETVRPPLSMTIFGGGLDACPVARLSKELGWRAAIVDPDPARANKGRFPLADDVFVARPDQVSERVPLDARTIALVVSHSYAHDLELLETLIPSPVPYIGLVGPRERGERLLKDAAARGVAIDDGARQRIHVPAGMDIGAETPQEFALSILAQVRASL